MADIQLVDREGNFRDDSIDRDRLEKVIKCVPLEERIMPHADTIIMSRHGSPIVQIRRKNKLFAPGAEVPIHGGYVSKSDLLKYEENPEEYISPYHVGAVRECREELGIHVEPRMLGDPIAESYIEPTDSKGKKHAVHIKIFGLLYDQSKYGDIIINKKEVKNAFFKSVQYLSREDLARLVTPDFADEVLRHVVILANEAKKPIMENMYFTIRSKRYLVGQYNTQGILRLVTGPDSLNTEEENLAIIEARTIFRKGILGMIKREKTELSHIADVNLEINPDVKDNRTITAYGIDNIERLEELARVFSQTYGMRTEFMVEKGSEPRKLSTHLLDELKKNQKRRASSLTEIAF